MGRQGGEGDGRRGGRPKARSPGDLVRRMIGEVALDVATTPEGRAAGLSVEVWPEAGVWLRVRSGHELHVFAEPRDQGLWVRWRRIDPQQGGSRISEGDLGPARSMTDEDLRTFVTRWLGWRMGGG